MEDPIHASCEFSPGKKVLLLSWFIFSLICVLGWGFADFFYKKGTDPDDRQSHLKIAIWVGLVMGVCSLILFPFTETLSAGGDLSTVLRSAVRYLPASLSYIVSMVIGYAGLRYLELSVASPLQNASGAFSAVVMFVWFTINGRVASFSEEFSTLDIIGTLLVVAGVIGLAILEQKLSDDEKDLPREDRKYRFGALALLFPLLYCLFDTIGTAADGIILNEDSGMALGEIDVLVLYGLTFFVAGLFAWLYMLIRNKKPWSPFQKSERYKALAACCEEFGQFFYIFAMARKPMLAAPMVASYCIVSVFLSRWLLKEKLNRHLWFAILPILAGIVILGISEGLAS